MKIVVGQSHLSYCLPEAGDIVTLPMKSVSLVVVYSSKLFRKMFHAPALPRDAFGRLAPLEAMHFFFLILCEGI